MASVAYSRTHGHISISSSQRNEIQCLVCSEKKSSIPSVDRLVENMKSQT